jgi:hypothetical protein
MIDTTSSFLGCLGKSKRDLRDNVRANFPRLAVPTYIHHVSHYYKCCCSLKALAHKNLQTPTTSTLCFAACGAPFQLPGASETSFLALSYPIRSSHILPSWCSGHYSCTTTTPTEHQPSLRAAHLYRDKGIRRLELESSASYLTPVQTRLWANFSFGIAPLTVVLVPASRLSRLRNKSASHLRSGKKRQERTCPV